MAMVGDSGGATGAGGGICGGVGGGGVGSCRNVLFDDEEAAVDPARVNKTLRGKEHTASPPPFPIPSP